LIYYHGTSKENANRIKEQGINPSESKYGGKIYLTTNYAEASKYGKITSNGKPGIVLKIHSDALTPEHIHSNNSGIIEYKGNIHKDHISEETNVGMIAGTGDSRLPIDQREPALNINIKNNKKILRRRKLTTHLDELSRDKLGTYLAKAHFDKNAADENRNNWIQIKSLENAGKYTQAGNLQKSSDIAQKKYRKRSIGMNLAAKHLLANEDTSELINSVIDQSPSNFYNIFSEIVNAKIDRYIDVMNEDIAADLFESNRLDELSRGLLARYIKKADLNKEKNSSDAKNFAKARKSIDDIYINTLSPDKTDRIRTIHYGQNHRSLTSNNRDAQKTLTSYLWDKEQLHNREVNKRKKGIDKALVKLAKEDSE
jgi:hypothetical protein